jgi:hypothetical protein
MGDQKQSPAVEQEPDMHPVYMQNVREPKYMVDFNRIPDQAVSNLQIMHRVSSHLAPTGGVSDLALKVGLEQIILGIDEGGDGRTELEDIVEFITDARRVVEFSNFLKIFEQSQNGFPSRTKLPEDGSIIDVDAARNMVHMHYSPVHTPSEIEKMVTSVINISQGGIPECISVSEEFKSLVGSMFPYFVPVLTHIEILLLAEEQMMSEVYATQRARLNNLYLKAFDDPDLHAVSTGGKDES